MTGLISMFRLSRALPLVAMVCCLSGTTALAQVTLIDDGFDDGGRTNGADLLDAEWYGLQANADSSAAGLNSYVVGTDPTIPADIDGSNALFVDLSGNTSPIGATADLPGATGGAGNRGTGNNGNGLAVPSVVWRLVNAGDFIKMEFDYRLLGTIPDSNRGFRFGFGNRLGTGDMTAWPEGQWDDQSYYVKSGTGPNTQLVIAQEFGGNGAVFDGSDSFSGGTIAKANLDDNDDVTNAMLTLTKLADGNIEADVNLGGDITSAIFGTAASCNASSCIVDTVDSFDFIGIVRAKATNANFDLIIDNVMVTTTGSQVPEPASLALFAMGLAATVLRRRR